MSDYKHIEVRQQGDVTAVGFLEPRLFDHLLLTELHDELLALIEQQKPQKLLVDFSRVEFCSTSIINSLLRIKKLVGRNDGQLKLSGMRSNVREAFQMLNLEGTVFDIYDSPADAEAAFG